MKVLKISTRDKILFFFSFFFTLISFFPAFKYLSIPILLFVSILTFLLWISIGYICFFIYDKFTKKKQEHYDRIKSFSAFSFIIVIIFIGILFSLISLLFPKTYYSLDDYFVMKGYTNSTGQFNACIYLAKHTVSDEWFAKCFETTGKVSCNLQKGDAQPFFDEIDSKVNSCKR